MLARCGCVWAAVLLLAAAAEGATDTYWKVYSDYWSTDANWTAGEPTAADDAHVNNGGYAIVDHAGSACDWLYVGEAAGESGTVWMTAGNLAATIMFVGLNGDGTYIQTGGALNVSNDIHLGRFAGSEGALRLWAGTISAQRIDVGSEGTGELTLLGGSLGRTRVQVGPGGTVTAETDWHYDGVLDVTGGAVDMNEYVLRLGGVTYTAGYEQACGLWGAGTIAATDEFLGYDTWNAADAVVRFYQTGGVHQVSDELNIGCGGYAYYQLSDGDLTAEWERIAYDNGAGLPGDGDFLQTGGTHTVGQYLTVGKYGRGTYELRSGRLSAKHESVGSSSIGEGEFLQTGGTHTVAGNLYVGEQGVGTFTLRGGSLDVGGSIRGGSGAGTFIYDGGTLTVGQDVTVRTFILGQEADRTGQFTLASGQEMSGQTVVVGDEGTGLLRLDGGVYAPAATSVGPRGTFIGNVDLEYPGAFDIQGGTVDFGAHELALVSAGATPTSTLAAGSLRAGSMFVGLWGRAATFVQTGGTCLLGGPLDVRDGGRYELQDGSLAAGGLSVGWAGGGGTFAQQGGMCAVAGALDVGDAGEYELRTGGALSCGSAYVGYYGAGAFRQYGGTHTVADTLHVGFSASAGTIADGTYELHGGQLSAAYEYVGSTFATGRFTQDGGTNHATDGVYVGANYPGTYTISAGSLQTRVLWLDPTGTFSITGPGADVRVSGSFEMYDGARFTAVAGSTVHMTGSDFLNYSRTSSDVAGLRNLAVVFEGGPADVDAFEVAGRDRGAAWAGWTDNFAMKRLELGGAQGVGQVRLRDWADNQPAWQGTEALYVEQLTLGPGSLLDLDGHPLYYLDSDVDPGAIITGGSATHVPSLVADLDIHVLPGGLTGCIVHLRGFCETYTAKLVTLGFSGDMSQTKTSGGQATPTLTLADLLTPGEKDLDSHFLLYDDDLVILRVEEAKDTLLGQFEIREKSLAKDLPLARIVLAKGAEVRLLGQVTTVGGQVIPLDLVVPEPASLALIGLGLAALAARRRRKA